MNLCVKAKAAITKNTMPYGGASTRSAKNSRIYSQNKPRSPDADNNFYVSKSSTFQRHFPDREQPEIAAEKNLTAPQEITLPAGQHEMVLVIDDEMMIREMTKTVLESFNYRVVTASSGREAIAQYTQHEEDIQVVLIDMMMPVLSGRQVIEALVKIRPDVNVIAMSGLAISGEPIANVKVFLPKPFSIKELLTAVADIINPAA